MVVEELVSKLGLEIDEGVVGTLEKFKELIEHGLGHINAFVGAGVVGMAALATMTARAGTEIAIVADKLGVGTEALQELKFAAELSHVSFEALGTGLKFLQRNAVEAAEGSAEAVKAFAGIQFKNAQGGIKSADELLESVAEKFDHIKDPAQQTALAMRIFGRQGAEMLPLLKKGAAGIEELRKEAKEFGVVLDKETIEASKEFTHEVEKTEFALAGLRNAIGGPLIPVFTKGLKILVSVLLTVREAVEEVVERFKKMLAPAIKYVTDQIDKLKKTEFVKALKEFTEQSKLLELVISGLAIAFGLLGIRAAASAALTLISWAAAAAPFILLGLLLGIIVDEIYNFIQGNDTLLGSIIKWAEQFDPNGNPVIEFFKSAIALLFDFTDPAKWDKFLDSAQRVTAVMTSLFVQAFAWIAAKMTELLGSAVMAFLDKFPWLKKMLGDTLGNVGKVAEFVGAGDVFSAAKDTAAGFLGLGPGQKPSEQIAAGIGATLDYANPLSGAANAVQDIANTNSSSKSVNQTNNITINGTGLNEEQVTNAVTKGISEHHQKAFAAVGAE